MRTGSIRSLWEWTLERISILTNSGSDLESQIGWLEEIRYQTELNADCLYGSPYMDMAKLPNVYEAFMRNLENHLANGLGAEAGVETRKIIRELYLTAKAMDRGDNLPALWMATLLSCQLSLTEFSSDKGEDEYAFLRSRCYKLLNWARCFRSFLSTP